MCILIENLTQMINISYSILKAMIWLYANVMLLPLQYTLAAVNRIFVFYQYYYSKTLVQVLASCCVLKFFQKSQAKFLSCHQKYVLYFYSAHVDYPSFVGYATIIEGIYYYKLIQRKRNKSQKICYIEESKNNTQQYFYTQMVNSISSIFSHHRSENNFSHFICAKRRII